MKIAIYQPYNIEKPGGVQDHVRSQAAELRKRGHEVVLLTPRPRKYLGDAPEGTIFTGVSARMRAASSTVDISGTIDQDEIDAIFRDNYFDVVHFHEPVVPFVGRQLISQCPYPVVATLHAALPETPVGRTLGSVKPYFRSVLQYVDVFTRVSEAAGAYLEEVIEGVEMHIVPNGIELKTYKPKASAPRQPATILFIGRLEKRKGPKYLLKAFIELKKSSPDARLILAGDGPEREKLHKMIKDSGVEGVEMPGFIEEDYKRTLLETATIACYPAIYGESFGIVLLEAMASGIPIVAGNNPGYSSVLRGRGSVGLVNPESITELKDRLELYLQDSELRQLLSEWGTDYVKQFDYAEIVKEYEKVYERAIEKHVA